MARATIEALLILAGLILWVLAGFGVAARVNLLVIGGVLVVAGWSWPLLAAGL